MTASEVRTIRTATSRPFPGEWRKVAMDRCPSGGQGFWGGIKEQFRPSSSLRAEELRRLEHEGIVRIEEGVQSRQTYTGFGAWKMEWRTATLALTRERVIVLIGWRRVVDVHFGDPAFQRVEISVDDKRRLTLRLPRKAGGGLMRSASTTIRLEVEDAGAIVAELEEAWMNGALRRRNASW